MSQPSVRRADLSSMVGTLLSTRLVLRQPTPTVMSLMGWSSESMAARYQHVTDAMRSQVATQVGDLIWNLSAGPGDRAAVTVSGDSLTAVLAVAEKCVASHRRHAR